MVTRQTRTDSDQRYCMQHLSVLKCVFGCMPAGWQETSASYISIYQLSHCTAVAVPGSFRLQKKASKIAQADYLLLAFQTPVHFPFMSYLGVLAEPACGYTVLFAMATEERVNRTVLPHRTFKNFYTDIWTCIRQTIRVVGFTA